MTNQQLHFVVGVPLLFNALGFTLTILYMNHRFADLKDLWRAVGEVLDARLKHVEAKLGIG